MDFCSLQFHYIKHREIRIYRDTPDLSDIREQADVCKHRKMFYNHHHQLLMTSKKIVFCIVVDFIEIERYFQETRWKNNIITSRMFTNNVQSAV